MSSTINIFVSYSHQDDRYLEKDSLLGFLRGLERDNIRFWTDRELKAGELWDQLIKQQLQACDIALVLVSQGFLDSEYCRNVEIAHLLAGTQYLFPVILSPCDWKRHAWLASRQFLPGGEKTVEEHFNEEGARKRLFLKIREQLLERTELLKTSAPNAGKQKLTFCKRLGSSWHDLADYFDIPPSLRMQYPPGQESRQIWEWLERRKKLSELAEALNYIERTDLTDVLNRKELELLPAQSTILTTTPYPGLRAFTEGEAKLFFGREADIVSLRQQLESKRFLAVIGASGSGKSSLVRAGLIPRLPAQQFDWVRFTPGYFGEDPFLAMANAFSPALEKKRFNAAEIAAQLRQRGNIQDIVISYLTIKSKARLLLFIDQFEELFTLVADAHKQRFVNILEKAMQMPQLFVILTVRADFHEQCLQYPALTQLINRGAWHLSTPNLQALRMMITEPAKAAGLTFEDGLVEQLLDDAGIEPGTLALMAFTLAELHDTCKPATALTLKAYNEFGGIKGAIAKCADTAYNNLVSNWQKNKIDDSLEEIFGKVFNELVEVEPEHGIPTRKRFPKVHLSNSSKTLQFIDEFTKAGLLVCDGLEHQAMVEVAHEALFTHWPKLDQWVTERKDDFVLRRQLQQATRDWESHNKAESYFWSHDRVIQVRKMLKNIGYRPTEPELEFVGPIDLDQMIREISNPTTIHERRALIGIRLSLVDNGDPRQGVGLRKDGLPDFKWCLVDSGTTSLLMTYQLDQPKCCGTYAISTFYISKYLVTWIQYRAFLQDPQGYANPEWWDGLVAHTPNPSPGRQFQKYLNHPVDNVSWLDAIAYCRWISKHLGYEIRLPTEWEWQFAATGGDQEKSFPWGVWNSDFINTYESGLNRSIAVGLYPKGEALCGASDMCGNVWELCLNDYAMPKSIVVPGNKLKSVRGGSWDVDKRMSSTQFDYRRDYDNRDSRVGFRVVCLAPII